MDRPLDDFDIVYVGCTEGGFEVLRNLLSEGYGVTEVVTLTDGQAERHSVAGYYPLEGLASEHDIPVYYPDRYEMDSTGSLDHFEDLGADLLIVNGWQRLVPEEVLGTFTRGGVGVHGSAYGLPKGRGRSPMNWTLLEGARRFLLSVITLEAGVDSGKVLGTRKFDVNNHDTIRSMYYKLVIVTTDILMTKLPALLRGTADLEDQVGEPTYYPKRTPKDGAIHWENTTTNVFNLVRAVSRPYPGAYTAEAGTTVMVWEAVPFSFDLSVDVEAGTVIDAFETTGDFIVKTGDGTLLITDWEAEDWTPEAGTVLDSLGERDRVDLEYGYD